MPDRQLAREAGPSGIPMDQELGAPRYPGSRRGHSNNQPSPSSSNFQGMSQPDARAVAQEGFAQSEASPATPGVSDNERTLGGHSCNTCGNVPQLATFRHRHSPFNRDEGPAPPYLARREASCRRTRSSKACCRSNSSRSPPHFCFADDSLHTTQEHRLFCTVGVHGMTPKALTAQPASASSRDPRQSGGPRQHRDPQPQQELQQKQQHPETYEDAACDAQAEGGKGHIGAPCNICGTMRAKAPSGFAVMRGEAPFVALPPKTTGAEDPQGGGNHGVLGRLPSCDSCGCLLSHAPRKGMSPYRLLKQQQQPRQGEVVAGGVQWEHPTSFWLIESAREEGIEREFKCLFRSNSPVSVASVFDSESSRPGPLRQ